MTQPPALIPDSVLGQHVAILGKTGAGKTSTEKLLVEQVFDAGARVCILDPIKSDWWGLISSADGSAPGLPFKILGGPKGHVPLAASSGAAIGELVADGRLPHVVIDMADFEPGGLQRFFVDFAPALLRHMRGVLYLVIEEAHEFAPKERAGFERENMALHFAKKLATAGRSKGVRLVVATQRVQSLHNAVLGSCETLIAHRLTTPADQKPVADWLAAHVGKTAARTAPEQLSSLPTGTGWLCAGEARLSERLAFRKFRTFDNAATPTHDAAIEAFHAPTDIAALKAIIGAALKHAEANDPKALRARIAELEKKGSAAGGAGEIEAAEQRGYARGVRAAADHVRHYTLVMGVGSASGERIIETDDRHNVGSLFANDILGLLSDPAIAREIIPTSNEAAKINEAAPAARMSINSPSKAVKKTDAGVAPARQRILDAIAWLQSIGHATPDRTLVALLAGASPTSSTFTNNLGAMRGAGLIDYPAGGCVALTEAGARRAAPPQQALTHAEMMAKIAAHVSPAQRRLLDALCAAYPKPMVKERLAEAVGASPTSSTFTNNLGRLRSLGLITYPIAGAARADDRLFPERDGS